MDRVGSRGDSSRPSGRGGHLRGCHRSLSRKGTVPEEGTRSHTAVLIQEFEEDEPLKAFA